MSFVSNLPLKDLTCSNCGRWVSCGPVYIDQNGGNQCGRCHIISERQYRNLIFESIATLFHFPCTNWTKHCNRPLQFNECLEHEPNCRYKSSFRIFCTRPSLCCASERKLPISDSNENLCYIPDPILATLICVYCDRYLSAGPVYTTPTAKSVCHRCIHTNGIPSTCLPNRTYESLAGTLIFPCVHSARGCTMRFRFGRAAWSHEAECPYGPPPPKKRPPPAVAGAKERGVIQTHSGHIYATITAQSALFGPPGRGSALQPHPVHDELRQKRRREEGEVMRRFDEVRSFDEQSWEDGGSSRASTLGDNVSREGFGGDNGSRDDVSRTTVRTDDSARTHYGYNPENDGGLREYEQFGLYQIGQYQNEVRESFRRGRPVQRADSATMAGVIHELKKIQQRKV